jgi:radical SAM protein with 4Fe4S-binding SPASM domain
MTSSELGYENTLLTNGTLVDKKRAAFLTERFSHITVSLDGPSEAVHTATRGSGNFQNVLNGIGLLAKCGDNVTVKMTVSKSNIAYAEKLQDSLPENVLAHFTPLLPIGRGAKLETEFIDSDTFLKLRRCLAPPTDENPETAMTPGLRRRRCHAGLSNISVADTGDVYPCHLFHYEQFRCGNIFSDSFDEIFFSRRMKKYVQYMDVERNNGICRECGIRFLCSGGCKANALHASGDYRGVDLYCSYLEETILEALFRQCQHTQP